MAEQLDALLESVLARTPQMDAVLLTDKDGVILAHALQPTLPAATLEPAFSATFAVASDQAGRLGLGRSKVIVSTFRHAVVVQFSYTPLILTILGARDANSDVLIKAGRALERPMRVVADAIQKAVQNDQKKDY
ncbi:hypothetical protein HKX48_007187 [Thoreauomyces humboldtii]|nr:hypothetical protein HKX48_007187 [Thoreauomyces humboldtii]